MSHYHKKSTRFAYILGGSMIHHNRKFTSGRNTAAGDDVAIFWVPGASLQLQETSLGFVMTFGYGLSHYLASTIWNTHTRDMPRLVRVYPRHSRSIGEQRLNPPFELGHCIDIPSLPTRLSDNLVESSSRLIAETIAANRFAQAKVLLVPRVPSKVYSSQEMPQRECCI